MSSKPEKATQSAAKKSPPTWKLFFLVDQEGFEADFVVARTASAAKRAFNAMYGDDMRAKIDLVAEIKDPPAWLKETTWLGPGDDVLEDLGGKRLPALHFPRWQFGSNVWGYPKTIAERYQVPAQHEHAPRRSKPASALDREKPIVSMSRAERDFMWAEVSISLNSGILDEARSGPNPIHVAAIVLVLRKGERRLVLPVLEYGDDEGMTCAKDWAREHARALAAGEALKVELREVSLVATRLLSRNDVERRAVAWHAESAKRRHCGPLDHAREIDEPILLCLIVLVLPDGERRVVSSDLELGDGEGLDDAETFARQVRDTKLLRRGERLEFELRECSLDASKLVREVRY